MRLAISMIAWPSELDSTLLPRLADMGIEGVELAPTRVWPDWEHATTAAAGRLRRQLADVGLTCPAVQSVLYGLPSISLFAPGRLGQAAFKDHMVYIADLAAALGANTVVFGSPGNRDPGDLTPATAWNTACERLAPIAEEYAARGVALALEANPEAYHCRFVTRIDDAARLVLEVNSPGLRLHVDAGGLALSGERFDEALVRAHPAHVHVSEPFLQDFKHPHDAVHDALASNLRSLGYQGWASVEMRPTEHPEVSVQQAIAFATKHYGRRRPVP